MRCRRGFTLLELIVSLAVAGVIALLVYGSASAGFDTRDALDRHRAGVEAELRARLLVADALRHASDEVDAGESAFALVDAASAQGLPADQLTFVTRGIAPPLGASGRWTVTIVPSEAGLIVRAAPIVDSTRAERPVAISAVLRDIRGIDVEVTSPSERAWMPAWPSSSQLPSAARLTLFDANGSRVGAPIVALLGLEAMP